MIVAQCSMQYTRGSQIVGRGPNFGCETFHLGSRNKLNLHFKFAILIRQNKCGYLGLLFYVLSFIQFCLCTKIAAVSSMLSPKIYI